MADVFISYANEDRDLADKLARALSASGCSVWWDRKIIAGQAFDQTIEHELETAKSVVVLWSKHSIASEWVKNEAAAASERAVLVPALIESVRIPLEFRRKQTADLIGWNGDPSHSGFQALCAGVSATIGSASLHQPILRRDQKLPRHRRSALVAIANMIVALGLGIYSTGLWRTSAPTLIPQDRGPDASMPSGTKDAPNAITGPADLVVGTYYGDVISDSKGSSRSDIALTITKLDEWTVRVTSNYPRLGIVDVTLTRIDNKVLSAGGDTALLLDLERQPPRLDYNPHGEVAYAGSKR